jgi:hypothetical protein
MGKCRFWQIHLSTAMVLLLAASGLLWINTVEREAVYVHVRSHAVRMYRKPAVNNGMYVVPRDAGSMVVPIMISESGWPFKFHSNVSVSNSIDIGIFPEEPAFKTYAEEGDRLLAYSKELIPYETFAKLAPEIKKARDQWNGGPYAVPESAWEGPIPYEILAKNFVVAFLVLMAIAALCETVVRRRERTLLPEKPR